MSRRSLRSLVPLGGDAQGVLVTVTGVVAIRLALTGVYLSYLKEGMRTPLLVAGIVLSVLGGVTIVRALRQVDSDGQPVVDHGPVDADDGHEGHDHGRAGPPVAWLLVLPLLAILLVAPAPLGAYAASRDSSRTIPVVSGEPAFEPLPAAVDGAVPMSLIEFVTRAYYDADDSLEGVPVRLSGFVVADPEVPDGYQLTRFTLSCCAADGFPIQVAVRGIQGPIPPNDTWVEVTGSWVAPPPGTEVGVGRGAALLFGSAREIDQPENPYE